MSRFLLVSSTGPNGVKSVVGGVVAAGASVGATDAGGEAAEVAIGVCDAAKVGVSVGIGIGVDASVGNGVAEGEGPGVEKRVLESTIVTVPLHAASSPVLQPPGTPSACTPIT